MSQIARTRAEAEQLDFSFSTYEAWRHIAALVDGYALAEAMGTSGTEWANQRIQEYEQMGRWDLPAVELAMMLFLISRSMRFNWGTEPFDMIDSILHELAKQTGQTYVTDPQTRERVLNDTSNNPPMRESQP